MKSEAARQQLDSRSLGATIKGINIRDLKRVILPIPPRTEQLVIALYLQDQALRFGKLKKTILSHLENLAEYRSALITAAVTGKMDLSGVFEKKGAAA